MKQIACLGTEAFILGFQLSGIRLTIKSGENILDQIDSIRKNKEIGIVIIEEGLLSRLESHQRAEIEDLVDPVFIPLSAETKSDNIRKLIIKSIGVDLWKN